MNYNFILVGLIFLISFLFDCSNGFDGNFSIEQICPQDLFKFENSFGEQIEINTIIKSQLDSTFLPISRYIVGFSPKVILISFENKNHGNRMVDLLKLFDNKIYEIYSDNYLNNRFNDIGNDFKLISKYYREINYLKVNHMINNYYSVILMQLVENGLEFVKKFDYYRRNKLEPTGEKFLSFTQHLNRITKNVSYHKKENLVHALASESEYELFVNYGLFIKNKFIPKNGEHTRNTLTLDFYLPYYDRNYNEEEVKDCVKLEELPSFFQNENKKKQ